MPRVNTRNTAAMRKRNSALALGLRVKATGRARRNSPSQVAKREAVKALGMPASATGRYRVVEHIFAAPAQPEVRGIKMVKEKQWAGNRYNRETLSYEPQYVDVSVPRVVVVRPAKDAVSEKTIVTRIKIKHSGPRTSSRGATKSFGALAVSGKRGTFRSRRSTRRP